MAFKILPAEYRDRFRRINALGLKVREGRTRVEGEGQSIYFYDYDNHMFELHSGTLEQRPERYSAYCTDIFRIQINSQFG
ncbi:MAG: hypothetical protein P8J82_02835 [Tateyamaria sp.]|nr:hypothetical protein [Tateyamaria sp.]